MELDLHIVKGPPVAKVSRVAAERKLAEHPEVQRAAEWKLREIEGIWVAAVAVPRTAGVKTASPPPFAPAEEAPPSEGPPAPTDGPPSDEGDAPDDNEMPGDEEKPEGDEGKGEEKGKGGVEHQVEMLTHMMHELMSALGLGAPAGPPEGPMGHEDPGAAPPPPSADASGGDGKSHTVHERALKPGEAPPGTLPVGSPTFASTHPDHPWSGIVGKKRSFTLEEAIGNKTMAAVRAELSALAAGTGYSVKRAKEGVNEDGVRVARVIVQADSAVG